MANNFRANPAPIDRDVQVPEAVRRAAAAADAAMQAATTPPKTETTPAPNVNPGEFISIAQPAPPQGLPNSVTTVSSEPPQDPPPVAQDNPPPAPQEPPASPSAEPNYKHMYESMLGRHRQASDALMQANSRIEALENMLATMQSMPPAAAQPASQPQPRQLVTQKDIDEVGPDLIDLMRRISQEQMPQVAPNVQSEIENLKRQVNSTVQTVQVSARQAMHNELDREVPNWKEINHHPDFHEWLALPDAFSGVTRKKLLTDAYGQNDAARVLTFFRSFASELAATAPTEPATIQPQPQAPSRRPAPTGPSLAELAAPGRARVAAAPTPPAEKQIIYTSDVNAFYADVRRGMYRGREQLKEQLEAELGQAMREGRVVRNT